MDWISIKKDLPPYQKNVILFCAGKDCVKGIDYGGWRTKKFGWLHSDGTPAQKVTHWRPMIQPPRSRT